MQGLSGRVALNLLLNPILTISGRCLPETSLFVVLIPELAAGKLYNFEREMVSYAVDVMGELLGVSVCFVFRLGLYKCQCQNLNRTC